MKKLNITKERFEKSKYFQDKYGKLEYVSESGKIFKTDKGKVLMFKESKQVNEESFDDEYEVWNKVWDKVRDKWGRMSDEIEKNINLEEVARNAAKKYFPQYADEIAKWLKDEIELIFTNGYVEEWTTMKNSFDGFAEDTGIQISDLA